MNSHVVDRRRPFVPLLDDALFLYRVSIEPTSEDRSLLQFSLPRQSILAAAMSVEAAANSCLDTLQPRGQTTTDLDKLQVLGKYDVYLLSIGKRKVLCRGHRDVQPISDLISLRNNVVHPKAEVREYKKISGGTSFRNIPEYSHLGIAKDREWSSDDAEKVLRKTVGFLRYFFVELCEHSSDQTREILCGEAQDASGETRYADISQKGREMASSLHMDLHFLGLQAG